MRKLFFWVIVGVVSIVFFVALAFIYLDFSSHKNYEYAFYHNGKHAGIIKIDKFITEDKIIYKSKAECPYYLDGYPVVTERLVLKRKTQMPLSYQSEATSGREVKRFIHVLQEDKDTSLLYVDPPVFFTMKKFEMGRKILLFSPYDILTYMPLVDQYSFWKKGVQFFEVMIPVAAPMPVLRNRIEVWFLRDDYIRFAGKRIESEQILIRSKVIPEAIVSVSKYSHTPIYIDMKRAKMRFELVRTQTIIDRALNRLLRIFRIIKNKDVLNLQEEKGQVEDKPQDVFFAGKNSVLSGRLYVPKGTGPFPAIVLAPGDGIIRNGDRFLFDTLAQALSQSGIVVMDCDAPGYGKSQGNYLGMTDSQRIADLCTAVTFLNNNTIVNTNRICVIGKGGGGYIAMKAAEVSPAIASCVILGLPRLMVLNAPAQELSHKNLLKYLSVIGYGRLTDGYLTSMRGLMSAHMEETLGAQEEYQYFLGAKLPVKAYQEYLGRKLFEQMGNSSKPLLLIWGKDSWGYSQEVADGIKALPATQRGTLTISTINNIGPYCGGLVDDNGKQVFQLNPDVLKGIENWVKKTN